MFQGFGGPLNASLGRGSRHVPGPEEEPGHVGETVSAGLGTLLEDLEKVSGGREVWASLLGCCPRDPDGQRHPCSTTIWPAGFMLQHQRGYLDPGVFIDP